MYRWLWDHLPGPTPVRALIAVLTAAAAIALLAFVVLPLLRPMPLGASVDGGPGTGEEVIVPDGVSQAPATATPSDEPTPSVPEDDVPQQ